MAVIERHRAIVAVARVRRSGSVVEHTRNDRLANADEWLQPTQDIRVDLNLKTAKALGVTIPQALQSRVDELIQ
jgi:hypothetical protein